jgi:hypothetical protein
MKRLRSKLTYANVISTLALFLALGGGAAFAASKIHTGNIAKGAVKTSKLHARAVSSGKLAVGAVRSNQIAGGAVSTPQIADGAVGSAQIGAGAVAPSNLQVPVFFPANPSGGSAAVPPEGAAVAYPLANSTWLQKPGQLNVIFGAATATLAYDGGGSGECIVAIEVGLQGQSENGESGGRLRTTSTKPVTVEGNLGGLPQIGPTTATTRQLVASVRSNEECTVGSTVDSARLQVVDFG